MECQRSAVHCIFLLLAGCWQLSERFECNEKLLTVRRTNLSTQYKMDLLGSIMGSMEAPPSLGEKEKKAAQGKRELVSVQPLPGQLIFCALSVDGFLLLWS